MIAEQNVAAATRVADRCVVLDAGAIVFEGPCASEADVAAVNDAYAAVIEIGRRVETAPRAGHRLAARHPRRRRDLLHPGAIAEVVAADEAGFDFCLVPEHHGGPRASIVAPLTLCAALAAVTSRIRIGRAS